MGDSIGTLHQVTSSAYATLFGDEAGYLWCANANGDMLARVSLTDNSLTETVRSGSGLGYFGSGMPQARQLAGSNLYILTQGGGSASYLQEVSRSSMHVTGNYWGSGNPTTPNNIYPPSSAMIMTHSNGHRYWVGYAAGCAMCVDLEVTGAPGAVRGYAFFDAGNVRNTSYDAGSVVHDGDTVWVVSSSRHGGTTGSIEAISFDPGSAVSASGGTPNYQKFNTVNRYTVSTYASLTVVASRALFCNGALIIGTDISDDVPHSGQLIRWDTVSHSVTHSSTGMFYAIDNWLLANSAFQSYDGGGFLYAVDNTAASQYIRDSGDPSYLTQTVLRKISLDDLSVASSSDLASYVASLRALLGTTDVANVTSVQVASSVATLTASNGFFSSQKVVCEGMVGASFLNVNVPFFYSDARYVNSSGLSSSQFKFNYSHADYGPTAESGATARDASSGLIAAWVDTIVSGRVYLLWFNSHYSGSPLESAQLISLVTTQPTTATLTSDATFRVSGHAFALTASITGAGLPSDQTVTFKEGTEVLGTVAMSTGVATLSLSTLDVGTHELTVEYPGDSGNDPSVSAPFTVVVGVAAAVTGTVLISENGTTKVDSSSFPLQATVTSAQPGSNPTGTVTFKNGPTTLSNVGLVDGVASFLFYLPKPWTYEISAEYSGDADNAASTSDVLELIITRHDGDLPIAFVQQTTDTHFDATAFGDALGYVWAVSSDSSILARITPADGSYVEYPVATLLGQFNKQAALVSVTSSAGVWTGTTATPHGMVAGEGIYISGSTGPGTYNSGQDAQVRLATASGTTFTVNLSGNDGNINTGGTVYHPGSSLLLARYGQPYQIDLDYLYLNEITADGNCIVVREIDRVAMQPTGMTWGEPTTTGAQSIRTPQYSAMLVHRLGHRYWAAAVDGGRLIIVNLDDHSGEQFNNANPILGIAYYNPGRIPDSKYGRGAVFADSSVFWSCNSLNMTSPYPHNSIEGISVDPVSDLALDGSDESGTVTNIPGYSVGRYTVIDLTGLTTAASADCASYDTIGHAILVYVAYGDGLTGKLYRYATLSMDPEIISSDHLAAIRPTAYVNSALRNAVGSEYLYILNYTNLGDYCQDPATQNQLLKIRMSDLSLVHTQDLSAVVPPFYEAPNHLFGLTWVADGKLYLDYTHYSGGSNGGFLLDSSPFMSGRPEVPASPDLRLTGSAETSMLYVMRPATEGIAIRGSFEGVPAPNFSQVGSGSVLLAGEAEVLAPHLSSLEISGTLTVAVGMTVQLTATAHYDTEASGDVTADSLWLTSALPTASVFAGLVLGREMGTVTISARFAGMSADALVTVTAPVLQSITLEPTNLNIIVGQQAEVLARGHYSDGSTADITSLCTWSCDDALATVNLGSVTGVSVGTTNVHASQGLITVSGAVVVMPYVLNMTNLGKLSLFGQAPSLPAYQLQPDVTPGVIHIKGSARVESADLVGPTPLGNPRSHRVQTLLNYFDPTDRRVRENPVTLDAQLLNSVVLRMDDLDLKLMRERMAKRFATAPTHLDNHGVWWSAKLPNDYVLPAEPALPNISVRRGSNLVNGLRLLDTMLPVPQRVERDVNASPTFLPQPVLCDLQGEGDNSDLRWKSWVLRPGVLALPNRLTFWVEGLGDSNTLINIHIEGERYPRSPWTNERQRADETLLMVRDGLQESVHPWAVIDRLTIHHLPVGARLRCWLLPVNMPVQPDRLRPYTDAGYRDLVLDRYWCLEDGRLVERYLKDNFGGLTYIQNRQAPEGAASLVMEPLTWGMLLGVRDQIYYLDRREPWADNLQVTGITREPAYVINVEYDEEHSDRNMRYVTVQPLQQRPGRGLRYRWVMEGPEGIFLVADDGRLQSYKPYGGWREGTPGKLRFGLPSSGTYTFSLETQDGNHPVAADHFPYANLATTPLMRLDASQLVASVQGMAYDFLGRLWLWDGYYAVPVALRYDSFLLDREQRMVYLTDVCDEVLFS